MNEFAYRAAEARLWRHYRTEPSETFVHLPVTDSRVRVQDAGQGQPILLLHGGPNAGSTWAPLAPHLRDFRLLLVDRPGTGLSEPFAIRTDNLAEVGARFVAEVLDGIEVERAHVVASSFGGHLALRSAARTPERFLRMVQMACPALVPDDHMPKFMKRLANPLVRWIAARIRPTREMGDDILRQIGHGASIDAGRLPDAVQAWYLDLQRFTDTRRNDFALIASMVRDPETARLLQSDFEAVTVPTLFLWGEDDTFGGEPVARAIVEWMPDAELRMLPAAGHLPWLDFPDGLAEQVEGFLRRPAGFDGASDASFARGTS